MAEDLNSIGHHPDPPVWASTPNLTTSDGAPTIPGLAVNDINIDITNGVVYSWDGDTWNVTITDGGGGGEHRKCFTLLVQAIQSTRLLETL